MPSMNPAKAVDQSLGIEEGNVKIVGAHWEVVQYQPHKETGRQAPPFTGLVLTLERLSEGWDTTGDPTVQIELSVGSPNKFTPSDDEKTSNGNDVGTKGRYLVGHGEFDKKSKGTVFLNSLVKAGFRDSELEGTDAELIVGLAGHLAKQKVKGGNIADYDVYVMSDLRDFPYERGTKGSKGKAKASASASAPKPKKDDDEDPVAEATSAILEANEGKELTNATAMVWLMKNRTGLSPSQRKEVIAAVV